MPPYRLTLIAVSAALAISAVVLAALLYVQGPRVRIVTFERNPATTSLQRGATVTLTFDRPLQEQDYSAQVAFTPAIDFSAQTSGQTIVLTLDANFQQDTDYSLAVRPEVFDETGRMMRGEFRHTFSTGLARYAYIERNYDSSSVDSEPNAVDTADDHVKLVHGEDARIIFSHPEILTFSANSDYAVVATKGIDSDEIHTVDLSTGEARREQIPQNTHVAHLALGAQSPVSLFTVTPRTSETTAERQDMSQVLSLNSETGEITTVVDGQGNNIRAFSIQLDPFSQTALVQDDTSTFYAVSPYNDYDPIPIGAHNESFGFNGSASEIVFRNTGGFARYDVVSGEVVPVAFDTDWYVQEVERTNEDIFYSTTDYSDGVSYTRIEKIDAWDGAEPQSQWDSGSFAGAWMRDFSVSYGGELLALQLDPQECRYDNSRFYSRCQTARTVVYDAGSSTEVTELRGFGLVWLP